MKLVLIHGRAQGGKAPAALKKGWLDALAYGCARAGTSLPSQTVSILPFYGDLLAKLVEDVKTPLGKDINVKGPNPDAEAAFRGEMIAEIAAAAGVTDTDVQREIGSQAVRKGPENWEWVQGIIRALDRIPGFNSTLVDLITRDVYVYLTYPGVRAQIDAMIEAEVGSEPCVVVAHSLGSVVAYNMLYKRVSQHPCTRFVTIGSPLGIRAIKQHIERPLRSPACLAHWFNAYDDRDVVALVPLDANNFDVTPAIENKRDVMNFTENRHGIEGYLADPVVALKVAESLHG